MQNDSTPREHYHTPGLFWPIVLIGVGVIWLLSNLGYLPADPWPLVARMWPVLLILVGLDVLLGRRSVLGSILGALLGLVVVAGIVLALLYAPLIPALRDNPGQWQWPSVAGTREVRTEQIAYPLGGARTAEVNLGFSSYRATLKALGQSNNLLEGTITHSGNVRASDTGSGDRRRIEVRLDESALGFLAGNAQRRADLALNPSVEYNLSVNASSGPSECDLTGLTLRSLNVDASSGPFTLILPERGGYTFELEASSGPINIALPREVGVRVEFQPSSGPLTPGPLRQVQGGNRPVYESANFNPVAQYVTVHVDGSSGPITFR